MTRLVQANINLDYMYGLQLTEGAINNCVGWLGVEVQLCLVPSLQSSPLKRVSQQSIYVPPRVSMEKNRVQFALEDAEDGKDEDDRPVQGISRMKDSAGHSLVINKYQYQSLPIATHWSSVCGSWCRRTMSGGVWGGRKRWSPLSSVSWSLTSCSIAFDLTGIILREWYCHSSTTFKRPHGFHTWGYQ